MAVFAAVDGRVGGSRYSVDTSYLWLAAYFFNGLILTIYNKAAMQFLNFKYPWALTGIHNLFSAVGCYILFSTGAFKPAKLSPRGNYIMLAFSFLYTINIAMSNVSLNLVTVPFHQIIRATTPVWVLGINALWLSKYPSQRVLVSLLPTILGVAIATYGDYYFTMMGFFLTVLGTVLSALKGVVTNQVQVGELKLHPMDLLMRMAPLGCIQTFVASWYTGELAKMSANFEWTPYACLVLGGNGILAFSMNLVSFTANKKTSALTMGVAGNVKQVLSILIAVTVFSLHITGTNGVGIVLTLCGGAYYSYVDLQSKQASQRLLVMHSKESPVNVVSAPNGYMSPAVSEMKRMSPTRERSNFVEGNGQILHQDDGHAGMKVLVR
ncbi:triose-phosphate transporter family-domain-containing protein [Hyaloraphidium curvatum]|nr:triose-phosphate transporter family-domain-containing protein [Hyaloraphidium curvatum]